MKIDKMRKSYERSTLERSHLSDHPLETFQVWWEEALQGGVPEPNAMTLATSSLDGKPRARVVLLKGVEDGGFVFYTSYISYKAEELAKNPQACLLFFWLQAERQIRIDGTIKKVNEAQSIEYFQSRPRGSQIGAWVSHQSQPIDSRLSLESKLAELEKKYENVELIPKPDYWGGYLLIPERIEFWQGRPDRLHDRFEYLKDGENWKVRRLQP